MSSWQRKKSTMVGVRSTLSKEQKVWLGRAYDVHESTTSSIASILNTYKLFHYSI